VLFLAPVDLRDKREKNLAENSKFLVQFMSENYTNRQIYVSQSIKPVFRHILHKSTACSELLPENYSDQGLFEHLPNVQNKLISTRIESKKTKENTVETQINIKVFRYIKNTIHI
jgi:hypothetical protein